MKGLDVITKLLKTRLHLPVIAKCYTKGHRNTFEIVAVNEHGFGTGEEEEKVVLTLNLIKKPKDWPEPVYPNERYRALR